MMGRWTLGMILLAACTGDPLPEVTVNPPAPPLIAPEALPDQRFRRPPPRDMNPADAGDAGPDATQDAARDQAVADALLDARPVDAAPDAAIPDCNADPCVLAVVLERCDPCPVGLPGGYVGGQECVVLFNDGIPLFEYVPQACTADCPLDSLQFCNEAVGAALCEADGRCVHAR